MSALGQKQTFAVQKRMSALPPKADMCGATRDVRFVPIADIPTLFDHLVGAGDERRRDSVRHDERHRRRLGQALAAAGDRQAAIGIGVARDPPDRRAGAIAAWAVFGASGLAIGPVLGILSVSRLRTVRSG